MTGIGRRDQLVTLERSIATQDDYGEEIAAWSVIGQEWAAIWYGRGSERRQAAMERGAQPATFGMLSNSITQGLTVADRLRSAGDVLWDIQGIAPDTPRRGEIEITAVRSA